MKKRLQKIKQAFKMSIEWINNICFVYATTKSEIRVFSGYGHFWLAKKYADRRTEMSKANKVCGGKRHVVLPAGQYSLIVLNHLEINVLKSKGVIPKSWNVNELFKNAYYLSK